MDIVYIQEAELGLVGGCTKLSGITVTILVHNLVSNILKHFITLKDDFTPILGNETATDLLHLPDPNSVIIK